MAKRKVVNAKVSKSKPARRMTKGAVLPWLVFCAPDGRHRYPTFWKTEKRAEKYIKSNPELVAPVIVHIDIPPMEY